MDGIKIDKVERVNTYNYLISSVAISTTQESISILKWKAGLGVSLMGTGREWEAVDLL